LVLVGSVGLLDDLPVDEWSGSSRLQLPDDARPGCSPPPPELLAGADAFGFTLPDEDVASRNTDRREAKSLLILF